MIGNPRLAFALAFPIACLAALTAYKQVRVMAGTSVEIPVAGFDPRDLLSGHYLTFRLDLGEGGSAACSSGSGEPAREALVCVEAERGRMTSARRLEPYELSPPAPTPGCAVVLRGRCEQGRFVAGVERFYVPEEHAAALDRAVRSRRGAVVVSVDRRGTAVVKDLRIDGKPWREAIREAARK